MIGCVVFSLAVALIAVAYGVAAQGFPAMGLEEGFGPGLFPSLIAALIVVLAVAEALRQVSAYRRSGGGRWTPGPLMGVSLQEATSSVIVAVSVVAAVLAMPYVGFIAASAALVLVLTVVMGMRPLWKSVAVSLGVATALYLIFSEGFGVIFAF